MPVTLISATVEWWTIGPLLAGALLVALARLLDQRRRRWWWVAPAWLLAFVLLAMGGYSLWYHHRPQPAEVAMRLLQPGMTYQRIVRTAPRPVIVHVVRIDLTTPGLRFFVTAPDPQLGDGQVRARTTGQFLEEFDLHVALNASFFTPWHANPPLSYYPHAGDPVRALGPTMSDGVSFGRDEPHYIPLALSADNRVTIGLIPPDARHVVSGLHMLLEHGQTASPQHGWAKPDEPSPRSAIALDAAGRELWMVAVDGRQANFSEGLTLIELASLLRDLGAHTALNLDGGGSTTLGHRTPTGGVNMLNYPIHQRVPPGRQRPVATHLGAAIHPPP